MINVYSYFEVTKKVKYNYKASLSKQVLWGQQKSRLTTKQSSSSSFPADVFFKQSTRSEHSFLHIPSENKRNLPCSLCETLRCFDVWRWKCSKMKYSFFSVGLIMYVSTVRLKTPAPVRDVSSVPFCQWRRIHYLLITGRAWRTFICSLMEILNEDAAHLSGHAE